MKVAIPFGGGGEGGGCQEVETLGKALPPLIYRLPRTVMIYKQFSYSVTPPPRVSGSTPEGI